MNFDLKAGINKKDYIILGIIFVTCILSNIWIKDTYTTLGIFLILSSICVYFKITSEDLFHPVALFSGFWVGVAGLSNFRLSGFQHKWSIYMFVVVFTVYITFVLGYYLGKRTKLKTPISYGKTDVNKLYYALIGVFLATVLCFIAEILILGFVPLFDPRMEAYQLFHVTGLHYFTVTAGILPCLTVVYKGYGGKKATWFINVVAFAIPVLIISRQLLLLQVISSLVVYNYIYKKVSLPMLIIVGLASMIIFSMLLKLRHQDTNYINEVSNITLTEEEEGEAGEEHKVSGLLNFINTNETANKVFRKLVQPYMYLTMNFENLRNIVENFNDYQYGKHTIFPVFAFTNTKKYVDYSYVEEYLTNENFTTSTFMSDVYYDFGYVGAVLVPLLFGWIFGMNHRSMMEKKSNKLVIAVYSIMVYCLIFSFFVPWYSSPTIWFYMGIIFIMWLASRKDYKSIRTVKI